MKLEKIRKIPNSEIVHYLSGDDYITSKFNKVRVKYKNYKCNIKLPSGLLENIFGFFRLSRRALRLDKCNVFVKGKFIVIIRKSKVYSYNLETNKLRQTLTLMNCRNILHQSLQEVS